MHLVREVETSNAMRNVRYFLLWRLGVWAFVGLVAVAGLTQRSGTSTCASPPRDVGPLLTPEEIELGVCLMHPPPVAHAVRSAVRTRAPGPSTRLGRNAGSICPVRDVDSP